MMFFKTFIILKNTSPLKINAHCNSNNTTGYIQKAYFSPNLDP